MSVFLYFSFQVVSLRSRLFLEVPNKIQILVVLCSWILSSCVFFSSSSDVFGTSDVMFIIRT